MRELILLNIFFNFQNELEILNKYIFGYLIQNPFDLAAALSCIFPIFSTVLYFKTIWQYQKILVIYVLLIFILEIIGGYYAAHSWNNHIFYLIFFFLESICLYIYFRKSIHNRLINSLHLFILIAVLLALFYNALNTKNQINDYSGSIQSLGFITISIISYYYILVKSNIKDLSDSAFFWINTGCFIYFSGMLFVFLYITKILAPSEKVLDDYYDIYGIILIIFRIFLSFGIFKIWKSSKIQF